jgi:hypothetical protein
MNQGTRGVTESFMAKLGATRAIVGKVQTSTKTWHDSLRRQPGPEPLEGNLRGLL